MPALGQKQTWRNAAEIVRFAHALRTPAFHAEVLARAEQIDRERFGADERVNASFEIVTLTGWAPHGSQQQPLKPGSAETRLADALGVAERSAGARGPIRKSDDGRGGSPLGFERRWPEIRFTTPDRPAAIEMDWS